MNKKNVFAVEDFLPVGGNTWLVRGRAYEDLKIGDTVAVIDESKTPGIKTSFQFIITAISTYGKEVQELNRMLTGELILKRSFAPGGRGANSGRLKKAGMLVKPFSERPETL